MQQTGLIPVFYHPDLEVAQKIVIACSAGGAKIVEFTHRGDRALDVFKQLAAFRDKEKPDIILGVGSICNAPTAAMYINAGADFVVGPLLDEETARLCNAQKIPYCPGCATLTEIHNAHLLGVEICKIFPADLIGGPAFVKAVKAPCPWVQIMPTGGVEPTRDSLSAWFDAGCPCVGMGSKLITKDLVAAGDFNALAQKIKDTLALIKQLKTP